MSRPLSPERASALATGLGPTPDGLSFAFRSLHVPASEAITCLRQSLRDLPHLTTVNISGNRVTSLEGLELAPNLHQLLAAGNALNRVLDYSPPFCRPALCCLTHADLSNNMLTSLRGVEQHPNLNTLILDGNRIASLAGIEHLTQLRELSVASNQLRCVGHLADLVSLVRLDLRDNQVDASLGSILEQLAPQRHLQNLSLVGNPIDVAIGHGVAVAAVVVWGFDDVEPHTHRAYIEQICSAFPSLQVVDGVSVTGGGSDVSDNHCNQSLPLIQH